MAKIPQEIKDFCEGPHLGFIATYGPEGINVTPKGSLRYLDEEHLLFADRFSDKTRKNMLQNKQVSVFMINRDLNKGFQFKGTAELLDSGPLVDAMNNDPVAVERKYPPVRYAAKIKVEKIYDQGGPAFGKQVV